MAVRVTSRALSGSTVCQQLTLHDGRTVDVITPEHGSRELTVHDASGELVGPPVALQADEADALAEVLAASRLDARLAALREATDALLAEHLLVPKRSPYAGRPISATRARGRTGASIVAVARGGAAQASPASDFVLESGDRVLAVGTREGLDQLGRILDGTG